MLKLTTDKHEASRGLSATAELLVTCSKSDHFERRTHGQTRGCVAPKIVLLARSGTSKNFIIIY